jgi:hypothetical protein
MSKEQTILGIAMAVLCFAGLWNDRWFLENTKKGQRLARWLGGTRGLFVLRALFLIGATFGILLATNVIRPVKW